MLIGASWEEVRMPLAALLVPIVAYWSLATFFEVLQMLNIPWVDRCRLHTKEEEEKVNLVTKPQCIRMVAVQHILQTMIGLLFLDPEVSRPLPPFWVRSLQVVVGMLVIDTWQYWMHRLFHENKFLYKHIHSHHHRLYAPYAFGALYNHPLEGLLFDTVSGALAYEISLMDNHTALYFFTFATLKTVMDHCSYVWPANPTFYMLPNNSLFHDVHHQPYGIKFNYSQPFFTHWDHWFGTYMPPPEHLYPQAVKGKVE